MYDGVKADSRPKNLTIVKGLIVGEKTDEPAVSQ